MGQDPPEHRNLFYLVATEWVEVANDANMNDYESVLRDLKLVARAENSVTNLLTIYFNREEKEPADEYYIMAERTYVRKRDEYRRQMALLLAKRDMACQSNSAHGESRTASGAGSCSDRQIAALEEDMSDATEEWRYVCRCLFICALTDVTPR